MSHIGPLWSFWTVLTLLEPVWTFLNHWEPFKNLWNPFWTFLNTIEPSLTFVNLIELTIPGKIWKEDFCEYLTIPVDILKCLCISDDIQQYIWEYCWLYSKISNATTEYLMISVDIWEYQMISVDIWEYQMLSGNIWLYLRISEDIWEYLIIPENFWWYLRISFYPLRPRSVDSMFPVTPPLPSHEKKNINSNINDF